MGKRVFISLIAVAGLTATSIALADIDELVEARQDNFKVMGKNSKALRRMFGSNPDWQEIAERVDKIQQANHKLLDFFPPDSAETFVATEAKAEIWDDFDDFSAKQKTLATRLDSLTQAIAAKDAKGSAKAFRQVGKACKACHDKYREE